jgi:hypothetical protein
MANPVDALLIVTPPPVAVTLPIVPNSPVPYICEE